MAENTINMLESQNLFINAPYAFPDKDFFFLTAGYGFGKSRGLSIAVMRAVTMLHGKKDRAGDGARIILAGWTLSHLEKTVVPYLKGMLESSKTQYTVDKKNNIWHIGTVMIIMVPTENPEDIFGLDVAAVFCDEIDELSEDKSLEAVKALRERARQRIKGFRDPFLAFSSTSQGQKGLFRIVTSFKKSGVPFVLIRGVTEQNIFLPRSQIESMKKMYTHEEYRVYMCGEFLSVASGKVFPQFSWEKNTLSADLDCALQDGERVYMSLDLNQGYSRGSAYIVRQDKIIGIKSYDFPELEDVARVLRHDFPDQRIFFIPDATAKDQFRVFYRELRKYEIVIVWRTKSPLVEDTVFLVNRLLIQGRLLFCPMAREVSEALALECRDKDGKIPKGVGPSSPVHYTDGVRYACSYICSKDAAFRDIRRDVMVKRASFRMDDEGPRYEGNGYTSYEGSAIKPKIFGEEGGF